MFVLVKGDIDMSLCRYQPNEQRYSSMVMKVIVICIWLGALSACTSTQGFIDQLPRPVDNTAWAVLLANSTEVEQYSLEHEVERLGGFYHDNHVFAEKLNEDGAALVEVLNSNIFVSDSTPLCWNPGHLISYKSSFGDVIVSICFECGRMAVEVNGWTKYLRVRGAAQEEFGAVLVGFGLRHPKYEGGGVEE